MPIIRNIEKNVMFKLDLLNNRYLDIKKERTDFENWIPFILRLKVGDKVYNYSEEQGATFTIYEIKNLITKLENIVALKENSLEFNRYEFSSSEGYFDFVIYDPLEANEVYIEIWINIGLNTEGAMIGYDDGVRFVTTIECLDCFKNELKNQLQQMVYSSIK